MSSGAGRRIDLTSLAGVPIAIGVVLLAQALDGGSARSLWQPTAALIVFGGTFGAVLVSFSLQTVVRTVRAVVEAFRGHGDAIEPLVKRLVGYAMTSRRNGVLALEAEIDHTADDFLRNALMLVSDGTTPKTTRQILDVENQARRAGLGSAGRRARDRGWIHPDTRYPWRGARSHSRDAESRRALEARNRDRHCLRGDGLRRRRRQPRAAAAGDKAARACARRSAAPRNRHRRHGRTARRAQPAADRAAAPKLRHPHQDGRLSDESA